MFTVLVKMPETANGSKSKPEGRGHTAEVWKYFKLSDDKTKTSCNLCRTSLAYSGGGLLETNVVSIYGMCYIHAPCIAS